MSMDKALQALPDALREQVAGWWADFHAEQTLPAAPAVGESLPRVWACSEFVARACLRQPGLLAELSDSGDLGLVYGADAYRDRLARLLEGVTEEQALARALRLFRRREMVRIAWRDLAGWAALDEVLRDLSALAETCIDLTLDRLHAWQCAEWGVPRNEAGTEQRMVVLGMGKLGGGELNFSSDIDLIFAFPEPGETDGKKPRDNEEFFTRLGRRLITALDATTSDGQVFRVDMRLRPYGASGPLAASFDALEHYYQHQGREWERYAFIKARPVGGDYQAGAELLEMLRPFVYRRYLDYGALEELRAMKAMIMREVARRGLEGNVKLSRGGIREIEFIGQAFQLIRGGREPALRERRILPVLAHLGETDTLPPRAVGELQEAYVFLRRVENRLQAVNDRQTHDLPVLERERVRLAYAMGFDSWERFREALDHHRRAVQDGFDQVFVAPQAEGEERNLLAELWRGELDEQAATVVLEQQGFGDPVEALRRVAAFRGSSAARALSTQGRARLARLMPLLLGAIGAASGPDETLARILEMLEAIARRTAYLSLLVEHPMALSQLVRLCAGSSWIARYLARHPLLLDELLDPRTLYAPLKRDALAEELSHRLAGVDPLDQEQTMELLRLFQQTNTLRVAAADISGAVPLMVVSDYLTWLAEALVEQVLALAYAQISARYGRPRVEVDGERREPGFGIVAYGKLGGIELGYGSDLDLVFLYEAEGEPLGTDGERCLDNAVFFARLTQRIIHILGTTTPGGTLYDVDTRLRPSGESGLLTIGLDAFAEYQRDKAWTWEHQALVRARYVAGNARLGEGFEAVRRETLCRERAPNVLRREVREMRERMRGQLATGGANEFDLKQDRGAIADIEFVVQYGVLSGAARHPQLLRYTDNIRLLDALAEVGWLNSEDAVLLADAYRAYRAKVHRLTLQGQLARVAADEFTEYRQAVSALWGRLMEEASEPDGASGAD
ncbi:bifunctional [glutamate--ammonia ligase]-adenylyl-L-tyrosine phosphorylase/[glutamate--ammonia-ligase] adenylyltransferase [Alkalilimnicola sp. S0819]|uniref:bifunctional [glutamate--ammonia ligase]-adenylyl-L-tyrosine phosphorylase/[glutamate--ammonia-ligase] adenylyltransferase n=1 Tax=Alkalilimnicola sp. S0819 TaxID=2613922 RepID=UPI0012624762|nr:bifunctional [glutamate--ammonia ligase]-adenylyl-L-tyrosine phosphorylase/[glutamate--ammonia-ligase] adenylyltransferase [Alkalilimnicola sp. S0819]KAB7627320.1 bifunctional [glutamate--ammonia ligase]-adenylyl-L-tyrosine phosphorylase/[glutamate--ammonia-ligase] adenylyltransferase [Alkalilimnicola sp. S0819]MPQ16035.1 bifunctional [glutamate--ammonia ligase]-adenylyl-L-tyrosine phosphorylase/[glutamate--ammonia-ligase] adenylyltransferase [Alkalilimnicola sp. S0819]